jgi:hypothetical protein
MRLFALKTVLAGGFGKVGRCSLKTKFHGKFKPSTLALTISSGKKEKLVLFAQLLASINLASAFTPAKL